MNLLDIILLTIIGLSILIGIFIGFIRELFSWVFFILAVIFSFLFYHDVGGFFIKYIDDEIVSNFAGFITIFTLVLLVGAIITHFIKKAFSIGPLKAIDRILGGVFGLLRGILISGIVVFALTAFPIDEKLVTQSELSPYILHTVTVIYKLLPDNFKKRIDVFKKKVNNNPDEKKGESSKKTKQGSRDKNDSNKKGKINRKK